MVVFVCGSCNESLKKNSVSLHLNRCRAPVISCCDCNKEFSDNSYQSHNQCITEDSKYGPESQRVYGANDKAKLKQDAWLNNIKETLKTMKLSGRTEMALNKLLEYPNIPRKQSKFENFANSCLQINSPELIGQLWSICESANKAVAGGGEETKPEEKKVQPQPKETTLPNAGETEDSKSNKKEKKKKKKKNEEETESGFSADKEEKSEESNETQGTENSGQNNGIGDSAKKSKKKIKQINKEKNQGTQETNGDEKDKMETEQAEQTEKTDSISEPVPKLDEEMAENEGEKSKKKSKKKKKRNHSETEENDESNGQVNGDSNANANENENEQRKKSKPDEENESILDEKIEQDLSTIEGMISELKNDPDNQISWFKQLKRQIKEKETVDLKDFKKMIKKLKKDHELEEEFTDLIAKAKKKLMKRHNYSVSDGQIQFKHLF